jgi:hypothetical protein
MIGDDGCYRRRVSLLLVTKDKDKRQLVINGKKKGCLCSDTPQRGSYEFSYVIEVRCIDIFTSEFSN